VADAAEGLRAGLDRPALVLRLARQRPWGEIGNMLVVHARAPAGRAASPTAGAIDRQSVKTTESGGVCGDGAGKKIEGRKRHSVTDTRGLRVGALIHAASIQAATARRTCSTRVRARWPWLRHVFADGG
jgi:hypothetical protein